MGWPGLGDPWACSGGQAAEGPSQQSPQWWRRRGFARHGDGASGRTVKGHKQPSPGVPLKTGRRRAAWGGALRGRDAITPGQLDTSELEALGHHHNVTGARRGVCSGGCSPCGVLAPSHERGHGQGQGRAWPTSTQDMQDAGHRLASVQKLLRTYTQGQGAEHLALRRPPWRGWEAGEGLGLQPEEGSSLCLGPVTGKGCLG